MKAGSFLGSSNTRARIYLLETGWTNGVLEPAGPGRVSPSLLSPT